MKSFLPLIAVAFIAAAPAHADFRQAAVEQLARGAASLAESSHSTLVKAQRIGFMVDEVRFGASLPPTAQVFFRDIGDNGNFDTVIAGSSGLEEATLRALQATRRFSVAHYSPTGVKLTITAGVPKVEIITTFQE